MIFRHQNTAVIIAKYNFVIHLNPPFGLGLHIILEWRPVCTRFNSSNFTGGTEAFIVSDEMGKILDEILF